MIYSLKNQLPFKSNQVWTVFLLFLDPRERAKECQLSSQLDQRSFNMEKFTSVQKHSWNRKRCGVQIPSRFTKPHATDTALLVYGVSSLFKGLNPTCTHQHKSIASYCDRFVGFNSQLRHDIFLFLFKLASAESHSQCEVLQPAHSGSRFAFPVRYLISLARGQTWQHSCVCSQDDRLNTGKNVQCTSMLQRFAKNKEKKLFDKIESEKR